MVRTDIVKSTIELCQLHIHFKDELRETSKKKKEKPQRKKVVRSSESKQRKIPVTETGEDLKKDTMSDYRRNKMSEVM